MSIWDATRYGWSPHYWLTISGVPVAWGERLSGLTLPSGYTIEDDSLVIDDSAEVGVEQIDRERGLAVSMSLTFKLLDTATSRDWLRTWSKSMRLTADQTAAATTATVDDSTGWSNGDRMYLGMESEIIGTVASGTSLTGISRAQSGSLAYLHSTGTTGQIITDRPRFWRGRQVVLWASPCDPSGHVTGANLDSDAIQVWKGKLVASPQREADGFSFEAVSLDRVLDQQLAAEVTGKVAETSQKHEIRTAWRWTVLISAQTSAGADVWTYQLTGAPFENDADGDLISIEVIRKKIADSWDDAVITESAGADLGELVWSSWFGDPTTAKIEVVGDVTIAQLSCTVMLDPVLGSGGQPTIYAVLVPFPGGLSASPNYFLNTKWLGQGDTDAEIRGLTIKLDEGDVGDVTAPGVVQVEDDRWRFGQVGTSQGELYLGYLTRVGSGKLTKASAVGKSAAILFEDEGTPDDLMLRALMSSGTTERSATYDTLLRGQGYGIDEADIKIATFTGAGSPVTSLPCRVSAATAAFGDMFGGVLGLFRRAVVCRPDLDESDHALKLTLVRTSPYGSSYSTTITNADLLSAESDPVVSVRSLEAPNVITVIRPLPGSDDAEDRMVFNDGHAADVIGTIEAEYLVPSLDRAALLGIARAAAIGHLAADQSLQAVELRVGPWLAAEVGDVVYLNGVDHPSLWTWSTSPGQVGYTGTAIVVGRRMMLKNTAVIITLLLDGALAVKSLSPAALISAFAGTAANPTSIDIDLQYLEHMKAALDVTGGNVLLYHYQPGQAEGATESHDISAAANVGGACRLTVDATAGGHSLSTALSSTLTLPSTDGGDIVDYQRNFAHVDDGSSWG